MDPVWQKIEEELNELKNACGPNKTQMEDELGDLFFALVNLARFLGIQSGGVSQSDNRKVYQAFQLLEARLEAGKTPMACSLEELDRYWDEAKALERGVESRK